MDAEAEVLVRVTVESDDKLDRTVTGAAPSAGSRYFRFPIRVLFVEAAEGFPSLGDGGPGLVRAGRMCHEATGGNGHLAGVRRLALCHSEAAGLFGRGGKIRWNLGHDFWRLEEQARQQQTARQYTGKSAAH